MTDDEYDLAPESDAAPANPPPQPARAAQSAARPAGVRTATAPAATTPSARPAAKAGGTAGSGAFVRGNRIVVKDGAVLPDRCVKCNAPAAEGRRTKRFAFNEDTSGPGAATLIPIVGRIVWIFWLIGQMNSRQKISVSYCVCKKHQTAQLVAIIVMAVALLSGVGLVAAGIVNKSLTLGIAGAVVFFIGAICGAATKMVSVANGLNRAAELSGAGKAFLDSMPKGGVPRTLNKYGR